MKPRIGWRGWLLLGLFGLPAVAGRAATAPDWLAAAARAPLTVATREADAVVLLDEGLLEVERGGNRVMRSRQVTKILNEDGKKRAVAHVPYSAGSTKIQAFRAWLIQPDGKVVTYGKKEIADVAIHTSALELYGEARRQTISAVQDARPGAIFGYEAVVEGDSVFNQHQWFFQLPLPCERSTFAVKLASGWTLTDRTFNHAPVSPTREGGVATWTLTALPALADEPMSPPARVLSPWLAIDLVPPPRTPGDQAGIKTGSWLELSRYFTPRYDAAGRPDEAMRRRVEALLAGVASEEERIRRLCGFVQEVNYIFIQLNAAEAGGMIPRPSGRVLQCNYGDCKDKATLLRALLAIAGIKAHPLIVQANGRIDILPDWPAPTQFNHCILAIETAMPGDAAAVLMHPALGRLLVFDPTDEHTPLGLLARNRLARHALLLAGEAGGLVELPAAAAAGDRLVRELKAEIDPLGNLRVDLREDYAGVASSGARAEYRRKNADAFRKQIEGWMGGTLPALREVRVEAKDRFAEAGFTLEASCRSIGYGKLMRDELLVFKPVLLARRGVNRLLKKPRTLPVVLRASAFTERTEFKLPPGYVVDELPGAVRVETDFGRYVAETRAEDGRLVCDRSLELRSAEVPAADYEKARAFFEKVHQSEQSPVVLRRVSAPAPVEQVRPAGVSVEAK